MKQNGDHPWISSIDDGLIGEHAIIVGAATVCRDRDPMLDPERD